MNEKLLETLYILKTFHVNHVFTMSYMGIIKLILVSKASICLYLVIFRCPIIYRFLLVLLILLLIVRRIHKT